MNDKPFARHFHAQRARAAQQMRTVHSAPRRMTYMRSTGEIVLLTIPAVQS